MPIRKGIMAGGVSLPPGAPTLGTITTSISSPNTVSTPSMTQDCSNASFSWSSPGAGGVTLGIPFTAPTFNGGLTITDYQYSTDNGSTWKSAGATSSPISVTTVSGSSSNLSAGTSYTVRLRAVNNRGPGTASSGSARTTPTAVTSYTIRVYNNRGTETLTETITGNTTGSYSRSHFKVQSDWSVTVAAVNTNGTGTFSAESGAATGWTYSSYDADYGTTRGCTTGAGCDSCGTKTGTEDGTVDRTCYQWTRSSCTTESGLDCVTGSTTWNGNCRDTGGCSGSWVETFTLDAVSVPGGQVVAYGFMSGYYDYTNPYIGCGGGGILGPTALEQCSVTGSWRTKGPDICHF